MFCAPWGWNCRRVGRNPCESGVHSAQGKGRIALGYDADFTVVDLKAARRIENGWMATKSGWTLFAGMTTTGWPVATIIRGRIVMRDSALLAPATGAPVRFLETLAPNNEV